MVMSVVVLLLLLFHKAQSMVQGEIIYRIVAVVEGNIITLTGFRVCLSQAPKEDTVPAGEKTHAYLVSLLVPPFGLLLRGQVFLPGRSRSASRLAVSGPDNRLGAI